MPQSVISRLIRKGKPDGECSMAERAEGLSFTGFRAEEMKHGV